MRRQKLKYVFFVFFLVGILVANIFGKNKLEEIGIFNNYFLQQYEYAGIVETDLFFFILKERVGVLFLLAMSGLTEFWYPVHCVFAAWNGSALGFLTVSALSNLGIKGILLVVMSLIPQYAFYIILYLLILEIHVMLHSGRSGSPDIRRGASKGRYLVLVGLVLIFFIFGILTETYLNPHIMKNILKIF